MNIIEQDIDLWEIWIEYDPSHPEFFGTLYVHGEVASDKKNRGSILERTTGPAGELVLQLPEKSDTIDDTTEVVYSEPIRNLNQYNFVCIYAGNQLIGRFHDIEVMI